ncbi:hypothetical protein GOV12_01135 [Candidatus Pacearchaeota archaeon]|nr:hypothetical protein [Candidatus Pacearchaeota archaeon]
MTTSGFITGLILTIAGLVLLVISIIFVKETGGIIITLIYSVIMLGVGIYLLFNHNKEDKIERVKKFTKNQSK